MRHSRESFSVLGFPEGDPQGRNAVGVLLAADAKGLVQMDSEGALLVEGGFSGAPVWSAELGAFVGIVVTELEEKRVAWCIPSRLICKFFTNLPVRFRIPVSDRPEIHDYKNDDPNLQLFGAVSNNGIRRLSARVRWRPRKKMFRVDVVYKCLKSSPPARGKYVTFVTHPSLTSDGEDPYELFSPIEEGVADNYFFCNESFTVASHWRRW